MATEENARYSAQSSAQESFLPRIIGIISGAIGGVWAGARIRDMSLAKWVEGRLGTGDAEVTATREYIYEQARQKHPEAAFLSKAEATLDKVKVKLGETEAKALEGIQKYQLFCPDTYFKELRRIQDTLKYDTLQAKARIVDKAVHKKIVQIMGVDIGKSNHKLAIYGLGAASAVAIGAVMYKATQWVLAHHEPRNHQQKIASSRETDSVEAAQV